MSIIINRETKVICQGITGGAGSFHTRACVEYGTRVVGGVTPGKGGTKFDERIPIFNTVRQAVDQTGADATMIFVPAPGAADAALEAMDAEIQTIVLITEGVPVLDMAKVMARLQQTNARRPGNPIRLIGPNCPGVISPEECKIGIMPGYIHRKTSDKKEHGQVGIVSRSGTLTYEAVWQLTQLGIGQSTVVGIGGDPIVGTGFIDVLELFEKDPETGAVVMLGEIGGSQEQEAAQYFKDKMSKPLIGFIAGKTAPPGKRMGHAGAIIEGKAGGTAQEKVTALKDMGVHVALSPTDIGATVLKALQAKRQ